MNDQLQKEMHLLIDHLEKAHPDAESTEGIAIEYLKCLLATTEHDRTMGNLKADFSQLKRFWLESVPWCSELSKQLEKIIILHDEFKEQEQDG
jgi:hypothetical protein